MKPDVLTTPHPGLVTPTAKTHKNTDKKELPKSWPIVGASRGLTTPLGEIVLDLAEPVAKVRPSQWEAQSMEYVLYKKEVANLLIVQRRLNVLRSMMQ